MKTFLPIIAAIWLVSCIKEKVLPNYTAKGKDTFGYIFEDSTIVGGDRDSNDSITYDFDESQFKFILKDDTKKVLYAYSHWRVLEIYLNFENYNNYHLDSAVYYENTTKSGQDPGPISESNTSVYKLNENGDNYLKITVIDDENRFIAGNFRLSLIANNSDPIRLHSGRFDFKY